MAAYTKEIEKIMTRYTKEQDRLYERIFEILDRGGGISTKAHAIRGLCNILRTEAIEPYVKDMVESRDAVDAVNSMEDLGLSDVEKVIKVCKGVINSDGLMMKSLVVLIRRERGRARKVLLEELSAPVNKKNDLTRANEIVEWRGHTWSGATVRAGIVKLIRRERAKTRTIMKKKYTLELKNPPKRKSKAKARILEV